MKLYKIFTGQLTIEQKALHQFYEALKQETTVKGALMADTHTGYTLPIGSVIAVDGQVYPSGVGYDIGCGLSATKLSLKKDQIFDTEIRKKIFDNIYRDIPTGYSANKEQSKWDKTHTLKMTPVLEEIFEKTGLNQLSSLGGGNHM